MSPFSAKLPIRLLTTVVAVSCAMEAESDRNLPGIALAAASDPSLSASQIAPAQQRTCWASVFPIGTEVHSLVVHPRDATSLYASTYRGVFRSRHPDDTNLWTPVWIAPSDVGSTVIRFSPLDANSLYLGTFIGERFRSPAAQLLRSTDDGHTWEDITGVIQGGIEDVALHPTSADIIYVATTQGLFKTLNAGRTWGTLRDGRVAHIAINPHSPEEVYATFWDNLGGYALYRSNDGGRSFADVSPKVVTTFVEDIFGGTTRDLEVKNISYVALAVSPQNPDRLFVVAHAGEYGFLLRSFDKGRSWETVMDRTLLTAMAFGPGDNVIYVVHDDRETGGHPDTEKLGAKIFRSSDDGLNWLQLPTPYSGVIMEIATLHSDNRYLYVEVTDLAVPSPGLLYAATNYGVFMTKDHGATWELSNSGLPVKRLTRSVLLADGSQETLLVGDRLEYDGGYWATHDRGQTWKWHFGPDKVGKYEVSASIRQIVVADRMKYIVSEKGVVSMLPDGTQAPLQMPLPRGYSVTDLFTSAADSERLYVVANAWAANTVLLMSEDAGFSWSEIDWRQWVPAEQRQRPRWHHLTVLAVDPRSAGVLYIAVGPEDRSKSAFLKTLDAGETWTDMTSTSGPVPARLVVDPSNSDILYAHNRFSVTRSDDRGQSWRSITPPVQRPRINDVAIDPANPTVLYAATDEGIWITSDGGRTWQSVSCGLLDASISRIVVSQQMIFAEGNNGIYRLSGNFQ